MKQAELMKPRQTKEQKSPLKGINNYTLYFLQLLAFKKGQNRSEPASPNKKHCDENCDLFLKVSIADETLQLISVVSILLEHTFDCQLWIVCVCVCERQILDVNQILRAHISLFHLQGYTLDWCLKASWCLPRCYDFPNVVSLHSKDVIFQLKLPYIIVKQQICHFSFSLSLQSSSLEPINSAL